MVFRIDITAVELEGQVRSGPLRARIVKEEMHRAITVIVTMMRSQLVRNTPSVSGLTRNAWQQSVVQYTKQTVGIVSNTTVSAKVFEDGAVKHFPPITKGRFRVGSRGRKRLLPTSVDTGNPGAGAALAGWIRKKLGKSNPRDIRSLAFLIGRKFKKEGRKRSDRWSILIKRGRPQYQRVFQQMLQRIIMRFRSKK